MKDLARLREMVYRAVGEGTGLPQDTDQYDTYYRQLILWGISNQEIAGAYRIGVGSELMARPEGARSFYSDSLFHFQEGLTPYLPKAMELGRTIILPQYQRDVTTLKLLMSGILTSIGRIPGMEYTLGPASISNSIPYFYKSLIVHFMLKNCSAPDAASMVKPGHPFQADFLRVNPDNLLAPCHSLDDLDRLILALSDGKYRLPVLLRKYVSFGARVVGFNVDPDFSNSLDAFVLQWVHDMPENSFRSMGKMLTPEELDEIRVRTQRV
jgi:putative hemolysin